MPSAATLITRALELVDNGRLDELDQLVDAAAMRFELDGAPAMSLAEFQSFQRAWAGAFPDQRHTVATVVDGGEAGAVEGTFTGTHAGPLPLPAGSVEASGAAVAIGFCIVGEARDGRLIRAANHFDALSLLTQLGGVPV